MSDLKKNLIIGAVAVAASDFGSGYIPAVVNVGGLPVAKWGAAVAGAWIGEKAMGSSVSIWRAVMLGVTALGGAELKDALAGQVSFPVAGIDVTRPLAGALALVLAAKTGIEKAA